MNKKNSTLLVILPVLLLLCSCDQSITKRHYNEVRHKIPAIIPAIGADPHAGLSRVPKDNIHANVDRNMHDADLQKELQASVDTAEFSWKLPEHWREKPGSGMRVATLMNEDENFPVEISIISLAGSAGGLNANITRWMRQIQINAMDRQKLSSFIQNQTRLTTQSGHEAILVDLTILQQDVGNSTPSMIASIINTKRSQIFLKMTGSKEAVQKHKKELTAITRSIAMND